MLTDKKYPMNLTTWHNLGVEYLLTTSNLKEEFLIEHYISEPKQNHLAKAKQNSSHASTLNKNNNQNLARVTYEANREQRNHVQGNRTQENIQRLTPQKINTAHNAEKNIAHNAEKNIAHNAEKNIATNADNTQAFKQSPPIENAGSHSKNKTLPLHEWPNVWKELLSNKNSAKVIWTYTGLGDDISGQGLPERKELIRRLIKELAFPAGTHAFWPLSLPLHEDNELNTQIFWSASERLESRAIVIMGSTALNLFNLPRKLRPLQQTVYNGYMLIVLPDINFLINEMQKYTPVREFIRTALKKYVQG